MGMIFEDLEDHEGYAARGRPSGTLTSTWIRDTVAFDAYVGACTCGWAGTGQHSPTEAGRTAAEDQWEHAHAGPLLAAAVPSAFPSWSTIFVRRWPSSLTTAHGPPAPSLSGSPPGPRTSCN